MIIWTAGGRWRRQHTRTELDAVKSGLWFMFHVEQQGLSK